MGRKTVFICICWFLCVLIYAVQPRPALCSIVLPLILKTMLGSGNLEKRLILPPRNKTPPSVNRFIKPIYGKLFNMSLEFDGMSPFQRAHRVQSVQWLQPRPLSRQPSICCLILLNLCPYSWRWTEIKTHHTDNIACSPESSQESLGGLSLVFACDWSLPDLMEAADWEKISV